MDPTFRESTTLKALPKTQIGSKFVVRLWTLPLGGYLAPSVERYEGPVVALDRPGCGVSCLSQGGPSSVPTHHLAPFPLTCDRGHCYGFDLANVAALKLMIKLRMFVLAVLGRFPAKLGPGTRSNGSGLEKRCRRSLGNLKLVLSYSRGAPAPKTPQNR